MKHSLSLKIGAFFLCCALFLGLFAGCKPAGESRASGHSDKKEVITFAGWGSLAEKKVFTQMMKEFKKAHPNVKINYQHIPGTQEDYNVKLISNLAAEKMPDVFYIHSDDFFAWADAGRLEDLTPYLEKSSIYEVGKIWDKAMNVFRFDKETKQVGTGALFGLPKDLGPWAMVYNKTLFQQKGVSFPDPKVPMTWDTFRETAKKLTSGEGMNKVFGTANFTLEAAVYSNGADFLSADKKTVTVDTPAFAEAMQWVADLSLKDRVSPTPEEDSASGWFQRWVNGKVAMAWMGPWDQATFWDTVPFEWDVMPTPTAPKTGKGVSWLASAALCVSPTSKHKETAYALCEYLAMDRDAQTINYQSGQAVPNLVDMAKNDFLQMEKMPVKIGRAHV